MLTFFRRIRKGLLASGATKKYILYAIGEILLVMIGILLALQVNNWNAWRKDSIKETKLLYDLEENLESNLKKLEFWRRGLNIHGRSSDIIISAIENRFKYNDSLEVHFAKGLFQSSVGSLLSTEGYESMKNVGFEIVRNDRLKKEVVRLFEGTYGSLQYKNDRVGQTFTEVSRLKHERFMRRHGFRFAPFDFDKLVEDKEFLSRLYTIKADRNWILESLDMCFRETQRVLQLIKDELGETDKSQLN